jgi:alkylation response protein AidB-like acyl-CoA dehydrogenase
LRSRSSSLVRFDLADVQSTAAIDGGHGSSGLKDAVRGAPSATHLIVTARTGGNRRDRDGVSVFLVARDAPGVGLRDYATVDGTRAADVRFEGAAAQLVGEAGRGFEPLEAAVDAGVAALCAEAVGVMRRLLADTVEYTRQRKQFDAPIATNRYCSTGWSTCTWRSSRPCR